MIIKENNLKKIALVGGFATLFDDTCKESSAPIKRMRDMFAVSSHVQTLCGAVWRPRPTEAPCAWVLGQCCHMCFCHVLKSFISHHYVEPSLLPQAPYFLGALGASARSAIRFLFLPCFLPPFLPPSLPPSVCPFLLSFFFSFFLEEYKICRGQEIVVTGCT